jgi:hypothetical protein
MGEQLFAQWVTLQKQVNSLKDKLYKEFSSLETLPSLASFLQASQQLSPSIHCVFF